MPNAKAIPHGKMNIRKSQNALLNEWWMRKIATMNTLAFYSVHKEMTT